MGPRQIMSVNGIPIQIVESVSNTHGNLVSLCIGEPTTLSKLRQEYDDATRQNFESIKNLEQIMYGRALEHLRAVDPELYEAHTDRTDSKWGELAKKRSKPSIDLPMIAGNIIGEHYNDQIKNTPEGQQHRDLKTRVQELEDSKIYKFAEEVNGVSELSVGSQAVLVFKKERVKPLALMLKEILGEFELEKTHYGYYRRVNGEQVYGRIREVLKKVEGQNSVGFIPQVEVLPKYRKQGLTKALLDVAIFLIEQGKDSAEVTYAKVMDENPYRFRMIDIFKRSGYEEIYIPAETGPMGTPGYSLMIRTKKPMLPIDFDFNVLRRHRK